MKRAALFFDGQLGVNIVEEQIPDVAPHQVLVRTSYSAISAGTEMLVYRGQLSSSLALDNVIPALSGKFSFPLKYGYSVVGRVAEVGPQVSEDWLGRRVFAFHPHESAFVASLEELLPIPPKLDELTALFLPNMESAVTFVLDARPLLGERALVIGQGIVGLLTTILLGRFPLDALVTLDRFSKRRANSLGEGAHMSLDPTDPELSTKLGSLFHDGADLTFELSGSPEGLDQAIQWTGFAGRIVVGSWYGTKRVSLDLGGSFHRSRITLVSSQVSTLNPALTGRWTHGRRLDTVWKLLKESNPARYVTHQLPLEEAQRAFRLIDKNPAETLQIVLTYPKS